MNTGSALPDAADPLLLPIINRLPVALLRYDENGRVDLFNPRAAELRDSLQLPVWRGARAADWALLEALASGLVADVRARLKSPGTVTLQQAVSCAGRDGRTRHLALTVTVPEPGACLLVIEDVSSWRDALAAQRDVEHRYRDLVEHMPAGVVLHGAASEIQLANAEASRLLGLSVEQLHGRVAVDPRWQFLHEDGRVMSLSEYPVNRVLSTGRSLAHLVIGIWRPDLDAQVWVLCNAFPVHDEAGQVRQVVVSFTDVSELKQAERRLARSEERLRLVLQASADAPWDWDLQAGSLYYSPRWYEMLGYQPGDLPADAGVWARLTHPEDRPRVEAQFSDWLLDPSVESYKIEFRLLHRQGHHVPVLSRGFVLRNAAGEAVRVSGTNADLTERKLAEERIHQLAYYDALTDLPNRRFLIEQLRKALTACARSGERGALLFIDLDHFKEINDHWGHDQGDELLRQVAQRLRDCVREVDMVARLGGDEFVVLLENLGVDSAPAAVETEQVGHKLLERLNQPYQIGNRPYRGTPSIGMTLFSGQSTGVDDLLRQADLAMYQAKAAGRNALRFYDADMQAALAERMLREAELREGIKGGELCIHLQPQVHHRQGLIGAEVLVRWQHPTRGLILPNDFVPLAEATGLIDPLGREVLRLACERLAAWAGDPVLSGLTLAVNVSAHQFRMPGFVDEVLQVLADTGAPAARLKLELTESAMAEQVEELIGKIDALRLHGVGFALDDFGTGYSSLSYLKRLPLEQIKIDRAFVRDVLTDPSDATLSRIIITLAAEFNLAVIAEGVETEAQRDLLASYGCECFQGYLYGRPEPVPAFEARARLRQVEQP
jgi:diguanylate cyclase (GGDEF)-like protein/PAS domain S-box-containing protein